MASVVRLLVSSCVRVLTFAAIVVAFIFGYRFVENGMDMNAAGLALEDAVAAALHLAMIGLPLALVIAVFNRQRPKR